MPMTRGPRRPRTLLRTAALACAAALTAAACSGTSGSPGAAASPAASGAGAGPGGGAVTVSAPHWHSCSQQGDPMQCARLAVPLDYARPGGRKISLALTMVPAKAPPGRRLGDLLVNPGGPGASGLSLASQVAGGLDPSVADRYNIIGFDPRGVGASRPALHCQPSFFHGVRPDYIPANRADERAMENRARAYAAACEHRYGWLLPFLTTRNMARDMDAVRTALHQQRISYFAYSYGTYLGQVYATLFGSHLRRMVLDSVVDPRGVWYADNIAQDYAFQGRMKAFFAWAAANQGAYRLGSTAAQVQRAWYQARARLEAHPIPGPQGPMIGPDEFDDTFLQGGYSNELWPGLADALAAYLHSGSTGGILRQYQEFGTQDENEFAIYNAVECSDVNWPRNWARWDADTRRVYRTAPFQAWDNAWFNAACAFWPVKGPARPLAIKGAGLPGILMIQGTLDAATPYAGALVARRLLPTARMVVVKGGGNHGQSLAIPPNTCVNRYLNNYLGSGALPGGSGLVNATCPALPPPAAGG
ncbi:MAG: alpha/beta fold hydrolase [Actinobacteria bacterium]|nr:alpha/beta fold hydrolase [Actinomycetota bacterium]MBO0784544.1 alpha/beta fold hydrolase [Actinomycetota bacterium]